MVKSETTPVTVNPMQRCLHCIFGIYKPLFKIIGWRVFENRESQKTCHKSNKSQHAFGRKAGNWLYFSGINSCCIQPTPIACKIIAQLILMCEHKRKYCLRCGIHFECKLGSILLCQCNLVTLTESERNYLQEKYDDCLCANCIKELKYEFHNNLFKQKLKTLFGIFSCE